MRNKAVSSGARLVAVSVGMLVAAAVVASPAELTPEWLARLPVGSSLTAGMTGMVVDAAGVSYVTGISGPSSNTNITTAAYAPDGSLLWSKTYNGPQNWHDQARGITLGPGGVVYVTGNTPGPQFFARVLVLAYDAATGTLLNSFEYTSGPGISEHGASVAVDATGAIFVVGGTVGDGADALVLAFEPNGQLRWKRTWDGPCEAPYSQDDAFEVLIDPGGDPVVLIHGVMASLHPDYVVMKYAAATGATVWQATWGLAGGDFPRDMEIDAQGDVYVTGIGFNVQDKFSTIRLRGTDGGLLWQAYDWTGYHNGVAALALDGQGGVYVTGTVDPDGDESNLNDNIYTVKRAAETGALLWSHLYGANCIGCYDFSGDVIVDDAGHAFVAGSTNSPPYNADAILLVLDAATGAETDRGIISGGSLEAAYSRELRLDDAANVLVGGEISNVNTGSVDMSVARYAALGEAGIPCADTLSFTAVCRSRPGSNGLGIRLFMTDTSHDGEQVTVTVDGSSHLSTIMGNKATVVVRGVAPGAHAVELTQPAGCFAPVTATCPDGEPSLAPGRR
jgi:PQQ-like domain